MKKISIAFISIFILTGCIATNNQATQEDIQNFFKYHKVGNSPDYAIMKNGTDHLITVHGMFDDQSACLDLIKPYNEDPSLSDLPGEYTCVPLNN